jgi:hypothetical protein
MTPVPDDDRDVVIEPPPPLGSWARFYTLVAIYHVVVVLLLWLLAHLFQIPLGTR